MNAAKWSPGPWKVAMTIGGKQKVWDVIQRPICTVGMTRKHGHADARLIAAAPELAELLSEVSEEAMGGTPDLFGPAGGWDAWFDRTRAALAKAKGETK